MSSSGLFKSRCPQCSKMLGVRSDQIGKRLRCPNCRSVIEIEGPAPAPTNQGPELLDPEDSTSAVPAAQEANELARAAAPRRVWPKAKITGRYPKSRDLVFQASLQAVRSSRCEIRTLDWANHHLQFAILGPPFGTSEHNLYAFDAPDGFSEIDISSQEPNDDDQFDPYYQSLVREVGKYLMFAAEPPKAAAPAQEPLSLPSAREDYPRRRRRRKPQESQALEIAGFVCGIVGLVLSCFWFISGPLGLIAVVFGGIRLVNQSKSGFAIASLVLGILTCLLAFVFFIFFLGSYGN